MSGTPPFREARIDLAALASNLGILRSRVAPAAVMAVVKAEAYGHGMVPVARASVEAGADWLGVADLQEAITLRSAGVVAPVLAWLHGVDADYASAIEANMCDAVSQSTRLCSMSVVSQ